MKLEVGKYYRTRDGRKARVICDDRRSICGLRFIYLIVDGLSEVCHQCDSSGRADGSNDVAFDLVAEWQDELHIVRHEVNANGRYILAANNYLHTWTSRPSFRGFEYEGGELLTIAPAYNHEDDGFGLYPAKLKDNAKLVWPVAVLEKVDEEK